MTILKPNSNKITTLTFVVKKPDKTNDTPRWIKVHAQNASCPDCRSTMAVVVGESSMYGYCPKCESYFIAD